MIEFCMPSLGADMEAGTLVEWLKRPGEKIARGDVIAVVETQKGAIEVECFDAGTFEEILVEPGTKVPVGMPLARIEVSGKKEATASAVINEGTPTAGVKEPATVAPKISEPIPSPVKSMTGERIPASPAARKLAEEKDIDLSKLTGSGPHGAIVSTDVLAAVTAGRQDLKVSKPTGKAPSAAKAAAEVTRGGLNFVEMRKAIGAAMKKSKREIPHYYLSHDIGLVEATKWLDSVNAERAPENRLLIGALFLKATALALKKFIEMNGFWIGDSYVPSEAVHLGVAVSIRGGGLIAPAVHDADALMIDDLMTHMRDLVARVRAGKLRSSEMTDPTATVSSLGDRGVDALYGIIYPPQVTLIGFGRPTVRPCVVDDEIVARSTVTVTLAGDHRASDGHRGALFLAEIGKLLQQPDAL